MNRIFTIFSLIKESELYGLLQLKAFVFGIIRRTSSD